MEDVFGRRKNRGGGIFLLKNSKMVVETQFFSWWELLPNMPCMQSLKAHLLFVKEQCGFLLPLHHNWSCVIIPLTLSPNGQPIWLFLWMYSPFVYFSECTIKCLLVMPHWHQQVRAEMICFWPCEVGWEAPCDVGSQPGSHTRAGQGCPEGIWWTPCYTLQTASQPMSIFSHKNNTKQYRLIPNKYIHSRIKSMFTKQKRSDEFE